MELFHNNVSILLLFFTMTLCFAHTAIADNSDKPLYLDEEKDFDSRADDLVARMTLEEKVSQLVNEAPAIERLGIPEYNWWNECLHGVARAGIATVFPQAIGLAATWDTDLMFRMATITSDEARAKHHEFVRRGQRGIYQGLTFWSPNINIFRDPRWGRGMETYGEDPYLTGRMGIEFVKGLQGNDDKYLKVVATVKHYAVHSGPESERHTFDAIINDRDFHETYLPHFKMCIEESGAYSVMGAYNRYHGESCCASYYLLTEILRDDWGFDGYVVSDCGAIYDVWHNHKIVETSAQAASLGIKSGCDLNCGVEYENLLAAVKEGHITEEEIDVSVKRLFLARLKLGMFDSPEKVSYAQIPYSIVDSPGHAAAALEAARKSIVLLKNENETLPLKKDLKTIAVIGPNADDVEVLLGNYNGNPSEPVTPLRGIIEKVSSRTSVLYALGSELAENLPDFEVVPSEYLYAGENSSKHGLWGEYFDNRKLEGNPSFVRTDPLIDFNWRDGAPHSSFDPDDFGICWTGEIEAPVSGTYALGANGFTGFKVFFEDKQLLTFDSPYHPSTQYEFVELEAGKRYKIKIEYYDVRLDAHMKLLWSVPNRNFEKEALDIAQKSDAVVMVMGLSPRLEGEEMKVRVRGFKGGDRLDLRLPEVQEELIKKVQALGKPTVLVLLNGSAVAVNWADANVPAIVEAWYPGQAAGRAIADVLFGDYNPAGRLPVTFYKNIDQIPPFSDYNMQGKTYRFFEGDPLYPFGHGLSYTTFSYSGLKLPDSVQAGEDVDIEVVVENTGERDGDEVVQLYLSAVDATVPVPLRELKAFQRITLTAGEKRTIQFILTAYQLSLIDSQFERVIEPGIFEVSVGGKQPGFKGNADASTTGTVSGKLKVKGKITPVE